MFPFSMDDMQNMQEIFNFVNRLDEVMDELEKSGKIAEITFNNYDILQQTIEDNFNDMTPEIERVLEAICYVKTRRDIRKIVGEKMGDNDLMKI